MGDPKGFRRWPRAEAGERPPSQRLLDWGELAQPRDPDTKRQQGARCMGCGIPFCQQGCPLGNRMPDFHDAVAEGRWRRAWRLLSDTNNFPELTGRLCPAPCEAACTLSINDKPVTIEQIEKEIAERAWAVGWEQPRPAAQPSGASVAIVGSGPAGLAAGQQLVRAGHAVSVFERADRPGGLLRYGIPDFKLDRQVLDRRLDQLRAEGVLFHTGVQVGSSLPWPELCASHDAVLVAIGAERPRTLDLPGEELAGVVPAMDFLVAQNRRVAGLAVEGDLDAAGLDVLILGGGDTGSDCLGTALRQGARSVCQLELLPEPPSARPPGNPWPHWPETLRTSSSHREGGERRWGWQTTRLSGRDGHIQRLTARPVDAALRPMGEEQAWPCDLLLLAMGFVGIASTSLKEQLGVALTERGVVATDGVYRSSVPGLYAAGDARRGASLVVWAIAEGREAARQIDADLRDQGQDRELSG